MTSHRVEYTQTSDEANIRAGCAQVKQPEGECVQGSRGAAPVKAFLQTVLTRA
jgi:hypothetical protein